MTNTGPLDFVHTFSVTVKTLQLIGIPSCLDRYPETWPAAVKANRGLIISFLSLAYRVLGQVIYFWTHIRLLAGEEMFLEFANQIACTGFCTVGLLKLFLLAYHRNLLAGLLTNLGTWWDETSRIPSEQVQGKQHIRSNMTTLSANIITNICMVSAFNLLPIAEMIVQYYQTGSWTLKLPYQIWFLWDPLTGWFYPLMYIFHVFSGLVVVIGNVGFDCIFCLITAHLSIQFNCLHKSFEHLVDQSNSSNKRQQKRDVSQLITFHQQLMMYKQSLESIFSTAFFVTFSGASVIICLQGIMITKASGYVVAKYFMFLLCIMLEIYFLCYYGQVLLESSLKIGTSAFHSYRYKTTISNDGFDADIGKRLVLIIMRTQKPFQLMAWKFWPLTVTSFSKIINASWSYFSLLNALLKE